MDNIVQQKGKIRIYACGGTAINIAAQLSAMVYNNDIMADIEIVAIDTSLANMAIPGAERLDKYVIPGLKGSGKLRTENIEPIKAAVPEIMHLHKPLDFNITLSSGCGGTGSVLAPLIMGRLMAAKAPRLALTVGGTLDLTETQNTLRTIQSYEGQVKKYGLPVNMLYLQNSPTMTEAKVDETMASAIQYLAVLFSMRNHRIDGKDLENWLDYTNVIQTREPQLSAFTIVVREAKDQSVGEEIDKLGQPISVATLIPAGGASYLKKTPDYQKVGILPDMEDNGHGPNVLMNKSVYFVITEGSFPRIKAELDATIEECKADITTKRREPDKLVTAGDDDGMTY